MSWFDELDKAERSYIARHRREQGFSDDVDPASREPIGCGQCLPCREGLTHISPCQKEMP